MSNVISEENLRAGLDAVLGLDPSQAPTDPGELNDRLSDGQSAVTDALRLLSSQAGSKHLHRAVPLVYGLLEAASRQFPEKMQDEVRAKTFAGSIAAVAPEARAAVMDGVREGPVRAAQPVLVNFLDQQLLGEQSFAAKLTTDERAGLYALCLGTVRSIDRHLTGAEQPVVAAKLPGRNDPCHCGSGKKFKKCHGGVTA